MSSCRSSGFFCLLSLLSSLGWSKSCEDLLSESTANVLVTESRIVLAGEFNPPGAVAGTEIYADLPEFCRVSLILTPSPDSQINVEVWLPTETWNGKYLAVGSGTNQGSYRVACRLPLNRKMALIGQQHTQFLLMVGPALGFG